MWILVTLLGLLATLAIFQGWRINKIEEEQERMKKENEDFDMFLQDICDTLEILRKK